MLVLLKACLNEYRFNFFVLPFYNFSELEINNFRLFLSKKNIIFNSFKSNFLRVYDKTFLHLIAKGSKIFVFSSNNWIDLFLLLKNYKIKESFLLGIFFKNNFIFNAFLIRNSFLLKNQFNIIKDFLKLINFLKNLFLLLFISLNKLLYNYGNF